MPLHFNSSTKFVLIFFALQAKDNKEIVLNRDRIPRPNNYKQIFNKKFAPPQQKLYVFAP
jgi:hypothetical protein